LVQSMLKTELGIPVTLTNQEWRVYLENTRANKMNYKGLARRGWNGDYVDPNTFLELLSSESINNSTGWKDPKYDALLKVANSEVDPAKRALKLKDAEQYMINQQPVIPLYVNPTAFVCKPYVKNLLSNLLDQHNWRQVYIDHNWQ
jgi:oligopeptide transport system substrate-binding protein